MELQYAIFWDCFFFHSALSGDPSWPFPVPLFPSSLLLTRILGLMNLRLFDPSSMEEHLGWFLVSFLVTTNKAAMNIYVQVFVQCNFSYFSEIMPRNANPELYRSCILGFAQIVRAVVLQHLHQYRLRGPASSHPRQHLELSVFLILANLIGVHERCSPGVTHLTSLGLISS